METRHNLRKIALLAGAALLSAGALAAPTDVTITRKEAVKYDIAGASTPAGAAALYRKLHDTAARVCGAADAAWLYTADSYASCVTDALDQAVRRVSVPLVSALHMQDAASGKLASVQKVTPGKLETLASR